MEVQEVIIRSKEAITIIVAWSSWIIANILNMIRKWQKVTLSSIMIQSFLSFFIWLNAYFFLNWLGVKGALLWWIIWIVCYSAIKLIEVLDLIKAETIFWVLIDFINYKFLGKNGKDDKDK